MKNYILFIPRFEKYYFLMLEFLAGKNFQIHKASYSEKDMLQNERNLKLQVTLYFPVEHLIKYLTDNVTPQQLKKYGEPSYLERIKKVPRKYVRKVHSDKPKTLQGTL